MRIALIADAFPPLRSSGAVQLRDLSFEFERQGHDLTVIVAAPDLDKPWHVESWNGVTVVRLRTPKTKDTGYIRRTIAEAMMPFFMLHNLRRTPLARQRWDGLVWYSPTIFLGPFVGVLKKTSGCPGYLIVRDIFPEWALDMGLLSEGLAYLFFKKVADYQYSVADVIGIQTPGNISYFSGKRGRKSGRIEVLHNWLADTPIKGCSIAVDKTHLAGRKIFVYAGNMGVAQGMDVLLDLAEWFRDERDIGFLFVGRGKDVRRLSDESVTRKLCNVAFLDEIDPDEIPGLYVQCHVGLVALDPRHRTHNIPGKFLSYMRAGLPVLACVNPGNDLVSLIQSEGVGEVVTDASVASLAKHLEILVAALERDTDITRRCKALASRLFAPEVAVHQIVLALRALQRSVLVT